VVVQLWMSTPHGRSWTTSLESSLADEAIERPHVPV
jgi:hypothetical protein